MSSHIVCLLGTRATGKTLLADRLKKFSLHGPCELGEPPDTQPTIGYLFTDLKLKNKNVMLIEMVVESRPPIVPEYFQGCSSVIFIVDSSDIAGICSSCNELLSVLSAEPLHSASVLMLFNMSDLPNNMSLIETRSLFRIDDIAVSATQSITILEISARTGQGLQEVLSWLESTVK